MSKYNEKREIPKEPPHDWERSGRTYGERRLKEYYPGPRASFEERRAALMRRWPSVVEPAVYSDGPAGLWVRCECGMYFSYLQDQVCCPRCTRYFWPDGALDMIPDPPPEPPFRLPPDWCEKGLGPSDVSFIRWLRRMFRR